MNGDQIREIEARTIRQFVLAHDDLLTGRVLDYGCGRRPYRDIVRRAGGTYIGFDREAFAGNVSGEDIGELDELRPASEGFDAILCTQVLQYVRDPDELLLLFANWLRNGGHLILTGPTNWPEVEPDDLHRHTLAGIRRMMRETGFEVVDSESRGTLPIPGFGLSIGYGVVGRA
jgi:predicted TPR repeat methyltransferase